MPTVTTRAAIGALTITLLCCVHSDASAQGRGARGRGGSPGGDGPVIEAAVTITLDAEVQGHIRAFYASREAIGAEGLPPGIRRNLERGKPLPPGIAKKSAPPELLAHVGLGEGFELVEVGLDVLLVEIATGVIHDVLMDIVR